MSMRELGISFDEAVKTYIHIVEQPRLEKELSYTGGVDRRYLNKLLKSDDSKKIWQDLRKYSEKFSRSDEAVPAEVHLLDWLAEGIGEATRAASDVLRFKKDSELVDAYMKLEKSLIEAKENLEYLERTAQRNNFNLQGNTEPSKSKIVHANKHSDINMATELERVTNRLLSKYGSLRRYSDLSKLMTQANRDNAYLICFAKILSDHFYIKLGYRLDRTVTDILNAVMDTRHGVTLLVDRQQVHKWTRSKIKPS